MRNKIKSSSSSFSKFIFRFLFFFNFSKMLSIKYSDLVSDTGHVVKKIFLWLNLKWSRSTQEFIENSSVRTSQDIYSTRKSPAVLNLPSDIISQIRKLNNLRQKK